MEDLKIIIAEREIPLRFKMNQFAEIEEEVGNLGEVRELITQKRERIRNLMKMIRIMGNAGLKHEGKEPDLTDEWLGENMEPKNVMGYQIAVLAVMTAEGKSEAEQEENENKERDLVLEQIQKKKEPKSLPIEG